ncbi:MAG: hypothetical protein KBI39_01315 [Firmicutes bacterium]|nr:hypothetical protein [Candidatus Fermentithermobacillaceae bacterium]HRC53104.1 hypothetical protein [Bacillota bacterium]
MALMSTLKILDIARIEKERKIPTPGEVMVKVGDVSAPDTIIAKTEFIRGNPYVIDLKSELKRPLDMDLVDSVLLKKEGDHVQTGEIVARYQKDFWSPVIEVKSPCDGFIEHISRLNGQIVIREDPRSARPLTIVAAASRLSVPARLLRMFTTVKEGEFVNEGQIIAAAPGVASVDFVYAPMSGVVEKICTLTGTITIARVIKHIEVLAHIPGVVKSIVPDYGAVVETVGAYIQGVFGIGYEAYGQLLLLSDGPREPILSERMDKEDVKGKVLVGGSYASDEVVRKAKEKGAAGLIIGGVDQKSLVSVLGKEMSAGITGYEESDFTIIMLEGFGELPMNEQAWDILSSREGKIACINGTTQIRAGVIRPEIVIPADDFEKLLSDPSIDQIPVVSASQYVESSSHVMFAEIEKGGRVRCIRPPYFGMWGFVEDISPMPEQVESEITTEVAVVRLDDGRLVKVPQANLEVFPNRSRE